MLEDPRIVLIFSGMFVLVVVFLTVVSGRGRGPMTTADVIKEWGMADSLRRVYGPRDLTFHGLPIHWEADDSELRERIKSYQEELDRSTHLHFKEDGMLGEKEIRRRVTYVPPNDERRLMHKEVGEAILQAMLRIDSCCPDSREKSICMTKLEEARMWANASIATNVPDAPEKP